MGGARHVRHVRAEAAIAGRAVFLARLLGGEMPDEIEEAFAESRLALFPGSREDLAAHCTCPDWGNPCKHIAAVYYLLAERFDEDPFLILAWRGRRRDRLLSELRVLRGHADDTSDDGAIVAAEGEPSLAIPGWVALIDGSDVPIDVDPDRFWGVPESIPRLDRAPVPTTMPDAILRELPASGLAGGDGRPIEDSLESLYVEIVRAAGELLDPR